jgi:hypothetical protein
VPTEQLASAINRVCSLSVRTNMESQLTQWPTITDYVWLEPLMLE